MRTQLLATFTTKKDIEKIISKISSAYVIVFNKIYVLQNALNEVISNLNNGVVDSKFIVPWENYKNTLLVTNSEGLNRINTRIFKIIKID